MADFKLQRRRDVPLVVFPGDTLRSLRRFDALLRRVSNGGTKGTVVVTPDFPRPALSEYLQERSMQLPGFRSLATAGERPLGATIWVRPYLLPSAAEVQPPGDVRRLAEVGLRHLVADSSTLGWKRTTVMVLSADRVEEFDVRDLIPAGVDWIVSGQPGAF